jgi:hypothetical protein
MNRFQIRFQADLPVGYARSFPCDAQGNVDMDRLTEADRSEYLFARIMVRCARTKPQIVALPVQTRRPTKSR